MVKKYLKVEKLKDGFLYYIDARNADFGIWNPEKNSFFISRVKFGHNFVFEEIHYDKDETFGTVKPLKEIEESPFKSEDIKLEVTTDYIGYTHSDDLLNYLNRFEGTKLFRERTKSEVKTKLKLNK